MWPERVACTELLVFGFAKNYSRGFAAATMPCRLSKGFVMTALKKSDAKLWRSPIAL